MRAATFFPAVGMVFAACAVGQVDRSQGTYSGAEDRTGEPEGKAAAKPEAKPEVKAAGAEEPKPDPQPVTDGDVTEAWVHGMQILVKRVPGAELASGQLYIRGGVRNWDAEDAGIEGLALAAAVSGGTVHMDRDAFQRKLAALGSSLGAQSGLDHSVVMMKSLEEGFGETFKLLAEAFLEPALAEPAIEVERQRRIAELHHELEDPDARVGMMLHAALFAGHPYANRPQGTEKGLARLGREALARHLAKLRETQRLLFVAVGDLEPEAVIGMVQAAFGGVPRGNYVEQALAAVKFERAKVSIAEQAIPTNYVMAAFSGPMARDRDYAAARVAMWVLGERVFQEVRTKRNLSYAPWADYSTPGSVAYGMLYVSAVDPNAAFSVMLAEAKRLQTEPVGQKELLATREQYLTKFWLQNETTDGQAALLGNRQLLMGDWRRARTSPDEIRAVGPEEIAAFASRYLGKLQTVVLGDPAKIDRSLFESL